MLKGILLAAAAFFIPTAACAAWHQASSEHFVVYADDQPERLQAFATKLERFDKAVRTMRGLDDPPLGTENRLAVYVVADTTAIQSLVGRSGVAGFYIPRAAGSVAFVPRRVFGGGADDLNADIIFFHEYAHHLQLGNDRRALPAWFVEGFAEFHSTARFQPDGSVWLGASGGHRNYGLTDARGSSLERMFEGNTDKMTELEVDALYGRGWVLTHLLTFDASRAGQREKYIVEFNRGKSSVEAARSAFGDLRKLRQDLDAYIRKAKLSYFPVPASRLNIGPVAVRPLSSGEAAFMPIRLRSTRGVNEKTALSLVPIARRAAAPYVNDPIVQAMLAEVEFDAKNYAQAAAAAARALARDPRNSKALIYTGRVKMAQATAAKSTDLQVWREARKWFIEASRVDGDNPEPKILFHQSFAAAGTKPTKNAVEALVYALELVPQDMGLRMQVARQHLDDNNLAEARTAIAPVAYSPHGGGGDLAKTILAKIDAGVAAGALAEWEKASATMATSS